MTKITLKPFVMGILPAGDELPIFAEVVNV